MAYHRELASILKYMGFDPQCFEVSGDPPTIDTWFCGGDPPTEAEVDAQVVPWKRARLLEAIDGKMQSADGTLTFSVGKFVSLPDEYLRRVALVNSHIASGGLDGLEWAESTLKASREVAETVGKQILEWVRNNSPLNPPDSVADISGPDFVTALRTQTELDQILDLRSAYNAAKAAINALTTEAELDAYDVTTTPEWPV